MSEKVSYDNYSKQLSKITSNSTSPHRISRQLRFPDEYIILESPNHKATVEINLKRIPDGSQALSPESRIREKTWNNRFNVVFSKQNHHVYTRLREYFDSPRKVEGGGDVNYESHSSTSSPKKHSRRRTSTTTYNKREAMWDTRYTFSSECNEVAHKTLRNYFKPENQRLPKIGRF